MKYLVKIVQGIYTEYKNNKNADGEDGGVGGRGAHISSQLGHLPGASGYLRYLRGWEEPLCDQVGCGGRRREGEAEAGPDERP